jgi:LysM repeat protein
MKIFCKRLSIVIIFLMTVDAAISQKMHGYKSGTLYYDFYVVRKSETLSQIAKLYNLSVNDILEVNTTISDPEKIVEGMKIKVPNYSHFIDQYPHEQWNFILYRIKQGDKLKNIAKTFSTNVEDIKNINPGIENKPVTGAEIRVPVKKQNIVKEQKPDIKETKKEQDRQPVKNPALTFNWGKEKTEETEIPPDTNCAEYLYKTGTTFKITLIAPLKKEDGTADLVGVPFLGGALIAVNEMKNNGLTIKLNTFDIGNHNSIDRILNAPELKESNLIIAQASVNDLSTLAAYASENRIHLVIPGESKAHTLVRNNPYVIQLYPSEEAVLQKLVSKQYSENIAPILIKPVKPDSLMLEKYRTVLKRRFGNIIEQTHQMGLRNLEYKNIMDASKLNLIFVCPVAESSKNQPFVSDLIARLNLVKNRLSVYGNDTWQNFEFIEKSHYFNTNVHLTQPFSVNYNDEATKVFVQQYRKAYNNEPGKYAFLGYDVTYYFLAVLRKYGSEFQDCLSGFDAILLQSQYKLQRNNINDGFINEGCFLLEYTRDSIEIKRE